LTNVSLLTVRVNDTLWSTTCDGVRFWDQTRFTGTDGIACWVHIAPSSRSTGIGLAGIRFGSTSVGSADQTHPAVRINDALRFATCDGIRVWSEPRYTSTLWVSISVDCTGCTWSTRSRVTGVHLTWCSYTQMRRSTTSKPVVQNYRRSWELGWRQTSIHRTSQSLGNISWNTGTDGVAIVVDNTGCEFSAGRWMTWRPRVLEVTVVAGGADGVIISCPLGVNKLRVTRTQDY